MLGPPTISARALAQKVGVGQPTLSRWLRDAGTLASMVSDEKREEKFAATKKWAVKEKLRVVAAAEGLEGRALGEFLRREGLHEAQLKSWRDTAAGALSSAEAPSGPLTAKQRRRLAGAEKRVKELERELRRKEKALAEAAALLMLEKKLQALGWDERHQRRGRDEDAESNEENEK